MESVITIQQTYQMVFDSAESAGRFARAAVRLLCLLAIPSFKRGP
jgi:hypothetical protein